MILPLGVVKTDPEANVTLDLRHEYSYIYLTANKFSQKFKNFDIKKPSFKNLVSIFLFHDQNYFAKSNMTPPYTGIKSSDS